MKYAAAAAAGAAVVGASYYLPMEVFQAFVIGWLFLIPATFAVYMLLGLREYLKERKHRIAVAVKPTEAMRALARREAELQREKELLYEELRK